MGARVEGLPHYSRTKTAPLSPETILRNIRYTWEWYDSFLNAIETGDYSNHPNHNVKLYKDRNLATRVAISHNHARVRFETTVKPALLNLRERTVAELVAQVDEKFQAAVCAKQHLEAICLETELKPGVVITPVHYESGKEEPLLQIEKGKEQAPGIKLPYAIENALANPLVWDNTARYLLGKFGLAGVFDKTVQKDPFQIVISFLSTPAKEQLIEYTKEAGLEARQLFIKRLIEEARMKVKTVRRFACIDNALFEAAVRDHFAVNAVPSAEPIVSQGVLKDHRSKVVADTVALKQPSLSSVGSPVDARGLRAEDLPPSHPLRPVWDSFDRDQRLVASLIPIQGAEEVGISISQLQELTRGMVVNPIPIIVRGIREKVKSAPGVEFGKSSKPGQPGNYRFIVVELAPSTPENDTLPASQVGGASFGYPKKDVISLFNSPADSAGFLEASNKRTRKEKALKLLGELRRLQGQRTLLTSEIISLLGIQGETFIKQSSIVRKYVHAATDIIAEENLAVRNMAKMSAEGEYALVSFPQEVVDLIAAEKRMREEGLSNGEMSGRYTVVQDIRGRGLVTYSSVCQDKVNLFNDRQQEVYRHICLRRVHRPVSESVLCEKLYPGASVEVARSRLHFILNQLNGILAAEDTTIINREDIFPTDGEPKYCIVPVDKATSAIIGRTRTSPGLAPVR